MPAVPPAPAGSNTVNPFILTDDAPSLIEFLIDVFGATEVADARTHDADGAVLHSELLIGDSTLTITDRKPTWPYTPAFVRVYVEDAEATLERAAALGARIVTKPTAFWGDVLSRFSDPIGNHLWWVYQHDPNASAWSGDEENHGAGASTDWQPTTAENIPDDASWESFASPELEYINSTLIDAIGGLRDPRG